MAVEKSKVIARLKALFPKANLSQKRLDALADKLAKKPADDADDTAIDEVINDFNEIMDITEIAKEDDRVRTLEANSKKPKTESKKEEEEEEVKIDDDAPAYVKAMFAKLDKVTSDLDSIKTGNITQTKKQTASQLFEKSEVLKGLKDTLKPKWIERIDVNSETPIEDQIKELETEYSELVQVSADSNSYAGPAGGGNPPEVKADQAVVDKMLQNI